MDIEVKVNGNVMGVFSTLLGHIPIMLRSSLCHLNGMSEEELVEAGEESLERGGYFINKGSEKVIRLLIGNKRNFPMALVRGSFKEKGKMFTEFGVLMRCLREGHSAAIMTLHYLDSASMVLTIQVGCRVAFLFTNMFLVPKGVVLHSFDVRFESLDRHE